MAHPAASPVLSHKSPRRHASAGHTPPSSPPRPNSPSAEPYAAAAAAVAAAAAAAAVPSVVPPLGSTHFQAQSPGGVASTLAFPGLSLGMPVTMGLNLGVLHSGMGMLIPPQPHRTFSGEERRSSYSSNESSSPTSLSPPLPNPEFLRNFAIQVNGLPDPNLVPWEGASPEEASVCFREVPENPQLLFRDARVYFNGSSIDGSKFGEFEWSRLRERACVCLPGFEGVPQPPELARTLDFELHGVQFLEAAPVPVQIYFRGAPVSEPIAVTYLRHSSRLIEDLWGLLFDMAKSTAGELEVLKSHFPSLSGALADGSAGGASYPGQASTIQPSGSMTPPDSAASAPARLERFRPLARLERLLVALLDQHPDAPAWTASNLSWGHSLLHHSLLLGLFTFTEKVLASHGRALLTRAATAGYTPPQLHGLMLQHPGLRRTMPLFLRCNDFLLQRVAPNLLTPLELDPETVLEAFRANSYSLIFATEALKADPRFLQRALAIHKAETWPPLLLEDRALALTLCRVNGQALRLLSPTLRGDEGVVCAALLQDGHALQWAACDLRSQPNMVTVAARQSPGAVAFADPCLCRNPSFMLALISDNPRILDHVHPRLRTDPRFMRQAGQLTHHQGLYSALHLAGHGALTSPPPLPVEGLAPIPRTKSRLEMLECALTLQDLSASVLDFATSTGQCQ